MQRWSFPCGCIWYWAASGSYSWPPCQSTRAASLADCRQTSSPWRRRRPRSLPLSPWMVWRLISSCFPWHPAPYHCCRGMVGRFGDRKVRVEWRGFTVSTGEGVEKEKIQHVNTVHYVQYTIMFTIHTYTISHHHKICLQRWCVTRNV